MSEQPSFSELLESKADDHKRPAPLPTGYYILCIMSHKFDKSSKKKTPFVSYEFVPTEPCEDVDVAALDSVPDWKDRRFSYEFYLTGKAAYRLTEFIRKCGVDTTERSFSELIPEALGCSIKGYINQRTSDTPGDDSVYNELTSFVQI